MKISLKEYIKERVEILLEERSVSDVVENMCDIIERSIEKQIDTGIKYNDYTFNYEKGGKINTREFQVGIFSLKDIQNIKEIYITIYNFRTKDDLALFARNTQYFGCKYDYRNNTIDLYCAAINNELYKPFLRRLLSHELKHAYRVLYFNFTPSKLYDRVYYLTKSINPTDDNYKIAYLLYWLYSDEIYANSQALYNECVGKKLFSTNDIINKSDIYNEFKIIKKWYYDIIGCEARYKQQLFLNIPFRKILNYIRKQIKYCEVKFGKVSSYIIDKHRLNERFKINNVLPIINL